MADGTVKITIEADGNKAIKSAKDLENAFGQLGKGGKTDGLTSDLDGVAKHSGTAKVGVMELATSIGLVKVASAAFGFVTSGLGEVIKGLNESSATWQTFEGNMKGFGKSGAEIAKVKKELQAYAQQTIYSASDMASTYAQLAAVGTKNTTQLVKGFGGLAAAAEDPQQAMKSLSQQATQMAAKPKVAWEDFKIMLEQTPAGMAAVAKEMGMSLTDLVSKIQDGSIKTDDFFDAISKAGTNDTFGKMATQYKTVGEAMDGLVETLTNKLQPAFDKLSKIAIEWISKLTDSIGDIDFTPLMNGIDSVMAFFDKTSKAMNRVTDGSKEMGLALKIAMGVLGAIAVPIGISAITGVFSKLLGVLKPMGSLFKPITSGFSFFGKSIGGLGTVVKGLGNAFSSLANAILKVGIGVGAASAGLALLAFAITGLAETGDSGIKAMVAFGATIVVLVSTFALLGGPLTAGAVGIAAFGAAVLAVGAGIGIASAGLALLATAVTGLIGAFIQLTTVTNAIVPTLAALGTGFGAMIVSFLTVIQTNMPLIIATFVNGLSQLIVQGNVLIPQIIQLGINILMALLNGISQNIGQMTTKAIEIITQFFNALAAGVPQMMDAGVRLMVAVLEGIARNVPSMVGAAVNVIVSFINGIASNLGRVVNAAMNLVDSMVSGILQAQGRLFGAAANLINGFANNIRNHTGEIRSAGLNLLDALVRVFVPSSLVNAGEAIMGGFLGGLRSGFEKVKGFVGGIASWIKEHKGPISYDKKLLIPAGNAIMNGLNNGLVDKFSNVKKSIATLTSSIANSAVITMPAIEDSAFNKSLKRINNTLNSNRLSAGLSFAGITAESASGIGRGVAPTNSVVNNYSNTATTTVQTAKESNDKVLEALNKIANNRPVAVVDGSSFAPAYEQYGSTETARRSQMKGRGLAVDSKF